MTHSSTFGRHAGLMDRMATRVGVDLEEAVLRGLITPSELTDAVLACTGCANADHCEGWLEDHPGSAERALDYCRNRALFDELRVQLGAPA